MLTSIRIQNFRSIRDASVKLGQVNLFIGPNNSGKSNFLKEISLFSNIIENYPEKPSVDYKHFKFMINRKSDSQSNSSINFSFKLSFDDSIEHFIIYPNGKPEIVSDNFYSIAKDLSIPPATRIEQ
ncbi:MAG: DUF2813 domain-containing protein [Hymenobacter sp.]|nr:MAG: DUF2813 domain-containing protein [Hymenobacter sp.]